MWKHTHTHTHTSTHTSTHTHARILTHLSTHARTHTHTHTHTHISGKPIQRRRWGSSSCTDVNSYYSRKVNGIFIPAGILQTPFYSPTQAEARNYGTHSQSLLSFFSFFSRKNTEKEKIIKRNYGIHSQSPLYSIFVQ